MSTTNVNTREPSVLDYASPVQFRFKCSKLPTVEFFCQSANIPGISIGSASMPTGLKDIPIPGEKVSYQDLAISFLVDENLNNYKEIHDWIIALGFPQNHTQFADLQAAGADRYPGTTSGDVVPITNTPVPLAEGGTYSDATLTVLNSKNIAVTEIRFNDIIPTALGSLSYDVQASDVNYLHASVDFSYMYYEIVQL